MAKCFPPSIHTLTMAENELYDLTEVFVVLLACYDDEELKHIDNTQMCNVMVYFVPTWKVYLVSANIISE